MYQKRRFFDIVRRGDAKMEWKEWIDFPDIGGTTVKALRSLVFREVLRQKRFNSHWTVGYVKSSTLVTARSVLFFVYNGNKPTTWNALENYLREKYGYAEGTVYGYNQHLLSYLVENCNGGFKLREEIYDEAIRILEDEEYANAVIEEAEELEWKIKSQFRNNHYDDGGEDEEDEEGDGEEEVSEDGERPSVSLVLSDGARVRVVLEVDVIIRSIRFEGE